MDGTHRQLDGGPYSRAQRQLIEAFDAARRVQYAPGSPEMLRLAQAEAYCQEVSMLSNPRSLIPGLPER